ncbi:hypothetical protein ACFX13_006157 [Malus domestica]
MCAPSLLAQCLLGLVPQDKGSHSLSFSILERESHLPSPAVEIIPSKVLANLKTKVRGNEGKLEERVSEDVQILLTSKEDSTSMRLLGAQCISKLIKVFRITIDASRVKVNATYVIVMCKNCKNVQMIPCWTGLGGAIVPRSCNHIPQTVKKILMINWVHMHDSSAETMTEREVRWKREK